MSIHPRNIAARSRKLRRGFGLVELLVAVAIFISIIGAIAVVFNGSLRSLRQAEQNQEMYEMVRGAMQVMERDLSSAFVAREYGDIYQFYGTPIGFTFVGLVKVHPAADANIARVTYVLRRDSGKFIERGDVNEMLNSAGVPLLETDGIDNDGDRIIFDTDGIDNDGDLDIDEGANGIDDDGDTLVDEPDESEGVDEPGEGQEVPTFSLLRFIERGVDNLETFPVDWDDPGLVTDDPDLVARPNTLAELVGNPDDAADSLTYVNFVSNAINSGLCRPDDARCLQEVAKAARRQIWIAMLAGQRATSFDPGLAVEIDLPDYFTDNGLDPEDYVLIENIAIESFAAAFANLESFTSARNTIQITPAAITQGEFNAVSYNGQFFQYTEWVRGFVIDDVNNIAQARIASIPNSMAFWLDWRNINLSNNGIDDNNSCCDGIDNDGDKAALDADAVDNDGNGLTDEGADGIDNDLDGNIDEADESEGVDEADEADLVDCDVDEVIAGLDGNGLDDDFDGIVDCPDPTELPNPESLGPTVWTYAPGPGPGSPLSPSIPQQMNFRFRVFAEAPTVGAADFERNFNFQIEIPTAATRVTTTE